MAIMISIQPQWVEKILNGEKIIEIRKTMPKCELPQKVYIYCTKPKNWYMDSPFTCSSDELLWMKDGKIYNGKDDSLWNPLFSERTFKLNGKVVAEFTLNKVTEHKKNFIDFEDNLCYNFLGQDVLDAGFANNIDGLINFDNFVEDYGQGKPLYAWHIDDLNIYDKPKELSEFKKQNKCYHSEWNLTEDGIDAENCFECCTIKDLGECDGRCSKIERPFQSWGYVEELC